MVDEAFQQKTDISPTNAPAALLEPLFLPDITNLLVMEPPAEAHKLPDPHPNMNMWADAL